MKKAKTVEVELDQTLVDDDNLSFNDILGGMRSKGQGVGDDDDDEMTPTGGLSPLFEDVDDDIYNDDEELDDLNDDDDDVDDDDEPVVTKPVKSPKTAPKQVQSQVEEDDDEESEYVSDMFDVLSEEYGWEADEEDKPKSIEELVSYMNKVVEERSTPTYSNEEVARLDEFVRAGGRMEDYLDTAASLNFDNIDIDKESDQRRVVKALLKIQGLTDTRIERKIDKYEYAGILEDEAEEALEYLKEYAENQKQALLNEQKQYQAAIEERQKQFSSSVIKEIETLKDIRGINIPEKEKRAVLEYLFKPTKNGASQFAIDLNENPKALIEAAYFVKNPNQIIQSAVKKGESTAVNRLRNKLKSGGSTKRTKQNPDSGYVPFSQFFNQRG